MREFFSNRFSRFLIASGSAFILALSVFGITACEIGLGSSVDTEPPKVSVTAPEADLVIRETFTMSGTCSDETGLKSVTAVLKNSTTGVIYPKNDKVFTGVIDEKAKTWTCTINPVSNDDADMLVPDGSYEAVVTATDKSGRTTSDKKSFKIDNTAPLLVLTRPSTKGEIVAGSTDNYGQEFSITGQVADDNSIDKMIVKVYDDQGAEKRTIELSNVPPTIDLAVAKYGTDDYTAIYGENSGAGTKYFSCAVTIYDDARHCPSAENDIGNSRTIYYLYNDIYSDILRDYKITDVYHMLAGTYSSDRGAEETEAEVEKIKEILNRDDKKALKGTFSLNPANNPTYSLTGYTPVEGKVPETDYGAITRDNELPAGSQMIVKMSAGLDKSPLIKDSLGIYLRPYVLTRNASGGFDYSISDTKIWIIKPAVDALGKGYPLATTAEEIEARKLIEAVGSYDYTASIVMSIDNFSELKTGTVYSVGVAGYDESSGNKPFIDSNKYGIYLTSSGSAPVLKITDPATGAVYSKAGGTVKLNGTVTAEEAVVVSLKVLNEDKYAEDPTIQPVVVSGVEYRSEASVSGEKWGELVIPAEYFNQDSSASYTVTVTANANGRTAERQATVYYDVEPPVIDGPTVSPLVTTKTKDASGVESVERENNVNKQITITTRINDAFTRVVSPTLKVWKKDEYGTENADPVYSKTYTSGASIQEKLDTTVFCDDLTYYIIEITASDSAGNTTSATTEIYVNQATDIPVVDLTNTYLEYTDKSGKKFDYRRSATDTFPQGGSVNILMANAPITATITDDDGIASVEAQITQGDTVISSKSYTSDEITSNPWPLNYTVPAAHGNYNFTLVVKDTGGTTNTVGPYWIKVDTGAPTIQIQSGASGHYFGKKSGPITVNGTAAGLGGLKVYKYYDSADPTASVLATGGTLDPTAEQGAWYDDYQIVATAEEKEEGSEQVYTVVDSENRTGTAILTYYVDNTKPVVTINALSGEGVINSNAYKFGGTAVDEGGKVNSGIDKIYYQIKKSGEAAPVVPSDDSEDLESKMGAEWTCINGSSAWSIYQSFVEKGSGESSGLEEGSYVLYVRTFDTAQNGSAIASLGFTVDLNAPKVETWYSTDGTSVISIPDSTTIAIQNTYTFAFRVSDTLGLNETTPYTLKVTKDGTELVKDTDYEITAGASGSAFDGMYIVTMKDSGAGTGDGTFVYNVTGIDSVNAKTVAIRTIVRDTEAPEIEISTPEENEWQLKNNVTVRGTAGDVSGVDAVYYKAFKSNPDETVETPETPAKGNEALSAASWTGKGWAKASGTSAWNVALTDLSQGKTWVYYAAVDKYGNISTVKGRQVCYDSGAPVVSNTKYTTADGTSDISANGEIIVNKTLKITGHVNDSYALKNIKIEGVHTDSTKATFYNQDLSGTDTDWDTGYFTLGTGENQLKEGKWTLTLTATDNAGKTTEIYYTLNLDTGVPEVSSGVLFSGVTPVNGWFSSLKGTVSVQASDTGSGLAGLSYIVSTEELALADLAGKTFDNQMNGSSGTYTRTAILNEGLNYVYIKAEDNAGNVTYFGAKDGKGASYTDTGWKDAENVGFKCSVDTEKPAVSFINPVGGGQINDKVDLTVKVSVSDEGSGFAAGTTAVIKLNGKEYTTGTTSDSGTITGTKELTVTIPAADLSGLTNPAFEATVTDKAGNANSTKITVSIDRDAPTVKINLPAVDEINGNVTVSGTSTDNVGVTSLKIYRTKLSGDSSESTDLTLSTGDYAGTYHLMKELTGSEVYNWKSDVWDTTSASDGSSVTFYVTAMDSALNEGFAAKKTTINQDADRPVITISNVQLKDMTSSARRVHQESEIRGIVTDDDGVTSLKIATADEIGKSGFDWASVENIYASGNWSYTVTAGEKTLVFRVEDSTGKVFVSNGGDSIASAPKITDKVGTTLGYKSGSQSQDTKIYLTVDLKDPEISVTVAGAAPAASYTNYNPLKDTPFTFDVSDDYKLGSVTFTVKRGDSVLTEGDSDGYTVTYTTDENAQKTGTIKMNGSESGNALDGTYTYKIVAVDGVGKTITSTTSFVVDTKAPTITVTYPDAGSYQTKKAVTIYGTSEDSSGIDSVYYKQGEETTAGDLSGWTALTGKSSWSFTTPSDTAEGATVYSFVAKDIYGNITATPVQYTLLVDVAAPSCGTTTWQKFDSDESAIGSKITVKDGGSFITNKSFTLTGTVSDSYRLSSIKVTAKYGSEDEKVLVSETGLAVNSKDWSVKCYAGSANSSKENYLKDGTWTFTLTVTDAASKVTTATYTSQIDTEAPSVTFSASDVNWNSVTPSANGYYSYATPTLVVGASDDGTGVSGVYCISTTSSTAPSTGIDYTMASTGSDSKYSRKLSLNDGINYAYVRATDEAGNESVYSGSIVLKVDTTGPSYNFTKPDASSRLSSNVDQSYVIEVSDELSGISAGTTGTLKLGSYSTAVTVVKDTDDKLKVMGTIAKADVPKDSDQATLSLTLADMCGNTSTGKLTLSFDNTPPNVSITNPAAGTVNGNIKITGTASDNVGLASVVLSYKIGDGSYTELKTYTGTDGYNWKYPVADDDYFDVSSHDTETITFQVVATDVAQNVNTVTKSVTVDQDADRPVITISNVTLAGMTSSNRIKHQVSEIRGIVTDDDGVKSIKAAPYAATIDWDSISSIYDSGSWTYPVTAGDKTLVFRVEDSTGKVFTSSTSDIKNSPKITDKSGNTFGYKDSAVTDTQLYLAVDLSDPVISVKVNGAVPASYYTKALTTPYTFEISDDYKLSETAGDFTFTVTKDGEELTEGSNGYAIAYSAETSTAKTGTITITGTAAGDGTYSYKITAKDYFGKSVTSSTGFVIDTKAPVLTVTSPSAGAWQNTNTVKIYGSGEDASGIAGVYYIKGDVTPTGDWSAWTKLSGKTSWNFTVSNASQGETVYSLGAVDVYGNYTESAVKYSLLVDTAAPVIESTAWTKTGGSAIALKANGNFISNKSFTLSGNITDTYKLSTITLTAVHSDSTTLTLVDLSSINDTAKEWSAVCTAGSGSEQLKDGAWTFTLTAVDAAGKTTTAKYTATVDTTAPVISSVVADWNSKTASDNGYYSYTKPVLNVTVAETGSGIAGVYYLTSATKISTAVTGIDYTMNSTSDSTVYTRTLNLSDGVTYAYIRVTDEAGNETIYGSDSEGKVASPVELKVDTTGPSVNFVSPNASSRLSSKIALNYSIEVSDALSGLASSGTVKIGSSYSDTVTVSDGKITGTVPQATMEALTESAETLSVTILDKAGNETTGKLTLSFDNTPPSVDIVNPAVSTVNGNIKITGTASDNVGLSSVKLYYKVDDGSETLLQEFTGTDCYNWNYSDTSVTPASPYFNTTAYDGKKLTFKVIATDVAGNTSTDSTEATVDQDADRPVITISNINLSGMTSSSSKLHQESEVRGIVTDDDGVTSIKIATASQMAGSGFTWDSVTELYDSGNWAYTAASGVQTLVFRVVDSTNGVFISNSGTIATAPKVMDKSGNSFGYKGGAIADTQVYLTVDVSDPVISVKVNDAAAEDHYTAALTTPYTFTVSDDYMLASVTYEITKDGNALASGDNGYKVEYTTDTTAAKAGTVTITGSAAGDGTYSYKTTAVDGVGKTVTSTTTFVIDTTAPVITVTSPESGVYQSKKAVTIYGSGEDASGIAGVYYIKGSVTPTGDWSSWTKLDGKTSWKFATKEADVSEGGNVYSIGAADVYGNYTTAATEYTLLVDLAAPSCGTTTWTKEGGSAITVKDNGSFITNKNFTLNGKVTDSYKISTVKLVALHEDGTTSRQLFENSSVQTTEYTWSASVLTGSDNVSKSGYMKDGKWTFTLSVTDAAGKETTATYTAEIDTVAPDSITVQTTWNSVTPSANGYYSYTTPSLVVTASDAAGGSGVAGVYCLSSNAKIKQEDLPSAGVDYSMSATGNESEYSRKFSLSDGTSYAYVRVVDEAGNEAFYANEITLLVDTTGPVINFTKPGTSSRLSNKVAQTFEIEVTDELSGVLKDTEGTVTISTYSITVSLDADNGKLTGTIPAEEMAKITTNDATLSVIIKDDAGNSNTGKLTLSFDNEDPTLSIVNPARSEVNGNITITGTASDNVGLSSVKLYYKVDSGEYTLLNTFEGTDGYNWKYTSSTTPATNYFDTTAYDQKTITFKAVAEDVAQNVTTVEKAVTVDQDSDRPEIKITNASLTGMTSSNSAWHKQSTIYGTVTDDDGITSLKIATATEKAAADFDWSSVANLYANGAWTYSLAEGSATLYFQVVDTTGGTYESNTSDITKSPKLTDSAGITFGYKSGSETADTVLYLTVDTKAPQINATYYRTDDPSADTTGNYYVDTLTGWKTITGIASDKSIGGPSSKLYILEISSDANGIASNGSKIGSTAGTQLYETSDSTNKSTVYSFATDSASGLNGYNTLTFSTIDNAGSSYSAEYTLSIDNTAPELSFTSHKDGAVVYATQSNNTVMGRSNDASKIYYTVSSSATAPDTSSITSGSSVVHDSYTDITDYVSTLTWTITYDTATNVKDTGTYHHNTFSNIIDELYGTGTSTGEALKDVYVWVFGKDALGNASTPISVRLSVDPKGDTPAIAITYPSNGETLGGAIRLTGYTEMSSVTEATVKGVYIQIDPTYDGSTFSDTWYTKLAAIREIAKSKASMTDDEIDAALGWKIVDLSSISSTVAAAIPTGKAISVSGSKFTSWGQNINIMEEFNDFTDVSAIDPSAEERTLALRVYAASSTNKVSDAATVVFKINPNSPVFGDWTLEDSDGNVRPYDSANNWISDSWTLVGSVTHKSGISTVTVTDDGAGISFETSAITDGLKIKIPVGKAKASYPEAFGSHSIKVTAIEGSAQKKSSQASMTVNYDNKAPVLEVTSPDVSTGAEIIQSDGTFTISGKVTEASTGNANQSGFERVAVYFTRELSGSTYVINSMILSGSVTDPDDSAHVVSSGKGQANYTTVKTGSTVTSGYTNEDGFFYKDYTISAVSGTIITLSETPDSNLQIGGILKIQNAFYRVKSINGSEITLDRSVDSSSAGKTAYSALAQIIDHEVKEGSNTDYYGGSTVENDDGDYMGEFVEDKSSYMKWSAYINSLNIPDGDVTIHIIAMDEAGNISSTTVDGTVINNRPRLAGVIFATDNNGNGSIEDGEKIEYSGLYPNGRNTNSGSDSNGTPIYELSFPRDGSSTPVFAIKGLTVVYPEIVGGNNSVGYSYSFSGGGSQEYTAFTSGDYGHATSYKKAKYDAVRSGLEVDMSLLNLLKNGVQDGTGQTYTLKIWDGTEGKTAGTDSQYATIKAIVDVAIQDTESAHSTIKPFYWNSATDNSVYFNKKQNGHIELEKDLPAATFNQSSGEYDLDPKLSGVIKLEGHASDNIQIETLAIKIGSMTDYVTFAARTEGVWSFADLSSYGITYPQSDSKDSPITNETFSNSTGHSLDFTLYYDTSMIGSPSNRVYADKDVKIYVRALDKGQASLNDAKTAVVYTANTAEAEATTATGDTLSNYYKADIVPYVTSLGTTLSGINKKTPSVYGRTAMGKYPIYYETMSASGSSDVTESVTVNGYNLTGGTVTVNGTSCGTLTDDSDFVVGSSVSSGKLSISVNEMAILNNVNNDDAKGLYTDDAEASTLYENYHHYYNRQPNNVNNDHLTDDVELAIWSVNSRAAQATSATLDEVNMHINPSTGDLGFAFTSGADRMSYPYGTNASGTKQSASYQQWSRDWTSMNTASFTYDAQGHMFGLQCGTDTYTPQNKAARFRLVSSIWGPNGGDFNTDHDWYTGYSANNALRLEYMGRNKTGSASNSSTETVLNPKRFKYHPQMTTSIPAASSTKTNLYILYYDDLANELKFRAGAISNTKAFSAKTSKNSVFSQETNMNFGDFYDDAYQANSDYNTNYNHCSVVAGSSTSWKPGTSYAIAVVPDVTVNGSTVDVAVVVWSDNINNTLWYSYFVDPISSAGKWSTTTATWSTPVAILNGSSGGYCAIAVDTDKHVHIASFSTDNAGSLIYTYLDSYNSSFDADKNSVIVDSYGTTGQYITMEVAKDASGNNIPYIGYYMTALGKPKYAYLADTASSGANGGTWAPKPGANEDDDMFTGAWESIMLPIQSVMTLDNVQLGVYKYLTATGTHKAGEIRAIPTGTASVGTESGKAYGNGTANPILGYGVSYAGSGYVETAQLK